MKHHHHNSATNQALVGLLRRSLAALVGDGNRRELLAVEARPDELDQIQSYTDREVVIEQLDQQARQAMDIRAALDKLETGGYGICERCEEPIPAKRLHALPWARFCRDCQEHLEEVEHAGGADTQVAA